ncbi:MULTISPECIES: hypothetical protein [Bosea]|uniref:hypothetical protein n=1 Tax=Bosea TaxID=85413 RepID=UPI0021500A33|nr:MULTISPECIES: hypothetical protein [Bosea]MCR4520255.1 hypothetical protein [Bosea sp. 47.2.35]MDR6828719.1 hypothetical protein [Bosea robiniae]MDR6895378.1 hypothetical protein [Bosea sp. BE109]MDR7138774.1 hypothetical protein [Bosea sp. BE168]MDR7175251.1 hypothetical protein [Bosea sp. BE271]
MQDQFTCPYCEAALNRGVLSCRSCGRDLTPVLPLLRRLDALEERLAAAEKRAEEDRAALAAARTAEPVRTAAFARVEEAPREPAHAPLGLARRRFWVLPFGLVLLLLAYCAVILWLDLPLWTLRLASIAIPFFTGLIYFGIRPRLIAFDIGVAIAFAIFSVATMNALLGWHDNIPLLPQGSVAWRETSFYALSIGASMFSGMLLRVTQAALTARGLVSLPELRKGLQAVHGKVPMETLKTIETTILMAGTAVSAIAGLIAAILGVK